MLEILLGQIPEAIFFALFMIYAKRLKEKRILFTVLMVVEYLLIKHFISFDICFQIAYTAMTFITLKILYKERTQIIDIFTFTIASIILIIISIISYFVFIHNQLIAVLINRISMFVFIFFFRNKLNNIQKIYKKLWNRETNKTKIKTTTFRSLNVFIFNIIFYIINIGMIYAILIKK